MTGTGTWICPDCHMETDGDHSFEDCVKVLRGHLDRAVKILTWIRDVNAGIRLQKLESHTLMGMIFELRGKAKEYFDK